VNRRETLHLIHAAPPALVERLPDESDAQYERRSAAIARLGVNWVRHPHYVFNPRHSVNPEVWKPARATFLAGIAAEAARDRARNPMFQTAERVRRAVQTP